MASHSSLKDESLAEMTATAIQAAAGRDAVVLLPIGVMECHGPHLPIGTDAFIASALCGATRRYLAERHCEAVIAPPFYWGINSILAEFPGSFRIRPQTASMLLTDVIHSLLANSFQRVLLISHHGDRAHNEMIRDVLLRLHEEGHKGVRWLYTPFRWRMFERLGMSGKEPIWVPWDPTPALEDFKLTGILGVHADEFETAAIVRYYPELVDYEALKDLEPTQLTVDDLQDWREGADKARRLTPDGYFGAPNPIDPELWRHFDETARIMAQAVAAGQ